MTFTEQASSVPISAQRPARARATTNELHLEYLLVAVVVLAPRLLALRAVPIFDDAFITFRYAHNLAAGDGLVYNLHTSILGTTTPLFAILLGGLSWLGLPPPITARFISIAADICTGMLSYYVFKNDFGRFTAIASTTVFAIAPYILRISLGGMEASLFLSGSLVIIFLLSRGNSDLAFLLAAITFYLRPEGVLLCALALACSLRPHKRDWLFLTLGVLVLLVPALAIWYYYGNPIPSSVAAKARHVNGGIFPVLQQFFFPPADWSVQTILTILGVFALPLMWRQSAFCRWLLVWVGLYGLAFLIGRPILYTWYAVPIYFVESVAGGLGLAELVYMLVGRPVEVGSGACLAALAIAAGLWASVGYMKGTSSVTTNVYNPLRIWCAEHVQPGDRIAAGDVGALGYFSNAYIYDLDGLVWPELFQYKDHYAAILANRPRFVFANVTSAYITMFDSRSDLGRLYAPVARFSKSGRTAVTPPSGEFTADWQQDYVMFEKRDSVR